MGCIFRERETHSVLSYCQLAVQQVLLCWQWKRLLIYHP